MSISSVQTAANSFMIAPQSGQQSPSSSATTSFTATLTGLNNDTSYTDADVKVFFAGNPTPDQIASKAASLGLNKQQILAAMETGGYDNSDPAALSDGVDSFMTAHAGAYSWGAGGVLAEVSVKNTGASVVLSKASVGPTKSSVAPTSEYHFAQEMMARNALAAKGSDRISTGLGMGPTVTVEQTRQFFATNPDDNAILKMAAKFGMSGEELSSALVYGRGDTYNNLDTNTIINNSDQYGYDTAGRIVALNGQAKQAQNGNSMLSVYGSGNAVASAAGAAQNGSLIGSA